MATNATKNLQKLVREVRQLRSFVIGQIGRDSEGEYRPEFIRKMLASGLEKPTGTYGGRGSLLKVLGRAK